MERSIQDHHEVRVGNHDRAVFAENHWREAILHYLFGMWSGKRIFSDEQRISFGDVTLALDPCERLYDISGKGERDEVDYNIRCSDNTLCVSNTRQDVEQGLIRFAKNPKIRALLISVVECGCERVCLCPSFCIWKKNNKGQYGVGVRYVATMEELQSYPLMSSD